jgi:hypothetical protein
MCKRPLHLPLVFLRRSCSAPIRCRSCKRIPRDPDLDRDVFGERSAVDQEDRHLGLGLSCRLSGPCVASFGNRAREPGRVRRLRSASHTAPASKRWRHSREVAAFHIPQLARQASALRSPRSSTVQQLIDFGVVPKAGIEWIRRHLAVSLNGCIVSPTEPRFAPSRRLTQRRDPRPVRRAAIRRTVACIGTLEIGKGGVLL